MDAKSSTAPLEVCGPVDHSAWDRLLKTYVDDRGLVDYSAWKASAEDRRALETYLAQFSRTCSEKAFGNEKAAALINAYNALTIHWVLENYPTSSILRLRHSFSFARHRVGQVTVSLDRIEQKTLRPLVGYRVHGALVCAARSCPPLARDAYEPGRLSAQLDSSMHRWLAREDLTQFGPAHRRVRLSSLFKWYREDFEKADRGLPGVLAAYAPEAYRSFLRAGDYEVEYLPYNWGLNDQGEMGRHYGRLTLLWDAFRNRNFATPGRLGGKRVAMRRQ